MDPSGSATFVEASTTFGSSVDGSCDVGQRPFAQELPQGRTDIIVTASEVSQLPALIGVQQACDLLGISRSAGYRAAAGDLPTIRLGRRLYVPTAQLCALIGLPLEAAG